ncbi:hypothetical protein FUA23_06545 [Neolewinella aurantiaca]|uniref:NERD domain-containing protein n=1 Tax=Neolewinella aurantiaca TaxID=2602767 RepID=A0A5C7FKK1_9BACT|nr:hypothetical protein [Neolewinella aurantiaca]TXF90444.1 hypothetical protein FUA23_06545 [Neolewinella aurantiaca]
MVDNLLRSLKQCKINNDYSLIIDQVSKVSKSRKKSIIKDVEATITDMIVVPGKVNYISSLLIVGYFIDEKEFNNRVLRMSVLRHSTYINKSSSPIKYYIENLQKIKSLIIVPEIAEYFENLKKMEVLYDEMKSTYKGIVKELQRINSRYRRSSDKFIRTILGYAEYIFEPLNVGNRNVDAIIDSQYFNKEQLLEGISFLIQEYDDRYELTAQDTNGVDKSLIENGTLEKLTFEATILKLLMEQEIMVESLEYSCTVDDGRLIFYWSNERAAKCSSIQGIFSQSQNVVDYKRNMKNLEGALSDELFLQYIWDHVENVVIFLEEPYSRYVPKIDSTLLSLAFSQDKRTFTQQEWANEIAISKQMNMTYDQIRDFKVSNSLTMFEFTVLNRMFRLMYFAYSLRLRTTDDSSTTIISYPLFSFEKDIYSLFEYSMLPQSKIDEYLDSLTWEAGKDKFLDLQYNPILFIDGIYIYLPTVGYESNLGRNVFLNQARKKINLNSLKTKSYDQLISRIEKLLSANGFDVLKEVDVKFLYKGKPNSDIDIFAVKNNLVLVIECKDGIEPISVYEDRTVLGVMQKAGSQLEYNCAALDDDRIWEQFAKLVKLGDRKDYKVKGLAVTTNRRMWGFEANGFSVRTINELENFFERGTWRLAQLDGKISSFKLRDGENWTLNDLIRFINPKTSIHRHAYDSSSYSILNVRNNIYLQQWYLDYEDLINRLNAYEEE